MYCLPFVSGAFEGSGAIKITLNSPQEEFELQTPIIQMDTQLVPACRGLVKNPQILGQIC